MTVGHSVPPEIWRNCCDKSRYDPTRMLPADFPETETSVRGDLVLFFIEMLGIILHPKTRRYLKSKIDSGTYHDKSRKNLYMREK